MPDTTPERPTFSTGQYIGAADLNAAVGYAREATERLALSARTWGISVGLAMVERVTTTGAVQMFIEPGLAWDGYGRPVLVPAPAPVTPDLFAGLASGNQVVWLRFRASDTQMIAPGFQTCGAGDPATRVAESYAIEAGSPAVAQRTDGVMIGGATVADPRDMLIAVDQSAAAVLDGSAPHQMFPDDTARWLIPVGIVSYTAGSPGSFGIRSAAQLAQNRLVRRYAGTVAESVLAADGVLRLRDRQTDQRSGVTDDALEAAAEIQPADIAADPNNATRLLGNELVWVEGNLRVTGNARLFGTRLELRDGTGAEAGGAPEFLRRGVSANNSLGGQDLQICIGASTGATPGQDRLAIGVVEPPDAANPDGVLDERVVIRSDAKMAVGTNTIDNYNTAANTLILATTADSGMTVVSGTSNTGNVFFADGTLASAQKAGFVTYDHAKQELSLGAGSKQVLGVTAAGQAVIGPADPTKFAFDADQLIVAASSGPAGITISGEQGSAGRIDFADGTMTPDLGFLRFDQAATVMAIGTASKGQVFVDGKGQVGIGTPSPGAPLQVMASGDGHALRISQAAIQAIDGGPASPLALQPQGGWVGIGTGNAAPNATLHVRGSSTIGPYVLLDAQSKSNGMLQFTSAAGNASLWLDGTDGQVRLWSNSLTAWAAKGRSLSIGWDGPPRTVLDVSAPVAGQGFSNPITPSNHLAILDNADPSGNVLALRVNANPAAASNNFITFFNGANTDIGAIEGSGGPFTTISYQTTAADYAEAVPRAPAVPPIGPGRVVGVRAGEVSLETAAAEVVFVTTDRPAVLGNAPRQGERDRHEMLAFLGQVPVLVAGSVRTGDVLLASGHADGMARAVPADAIRPEDLALIVGRAWEDADGAAPRRVNALVGPGIAGAAMAALLARQGHEIERLTGLLARQAGVDAD